ncbi:pantothenate kinase [Mesobacillus persicus]|uniref:Pantothenate kinase n=1 Tax=Mesobacillus persicus TaxID=930146 RepID=A0A1H8F003_9BACI|nr:type II pantothenate kinase [Mesobacillus persicus]SEN24328.1 pantothenate kinase [Mesobacillus persicus]
MNRQRLGIDAGGSLIKIAFEQNGQFRLKKYPISELKEMANWLKMTAGNAEINLTGGRADYLKENYFQQARVVPEFKASCEGAIYLLNKDEIKLGAKYLLVNIGTGTSWYLIDGHKNERILGSGIGGGTFMGLGKLLVGSDDYQNLVDLIKEGDREKVDLLVKDIYHSESPIGGDLTASNFAKATFTNEHTPADQLASTVNMMAETIVLLSKQTSVAHQLSEVVYIGSSLIGNQSLKDGLASYSTMVGLSPNFLQDGEYSGAIGALIV